jgi:hypothetical protein
MAWVAVIVCPLALGGIIMKDFFAGAAFFPTGPRAGSDDGFFGVVILASAIESVFSFWLSRRNSGSDKDNFLKTQTHG